MSVLEVRDALLTVTKEVYHCKAPEGIKRYIVWVEGGGSGTDPWADNKMQQQSISGTADYYTDTEYDITVDKIQLAFSDADISFSIISLEYYNDTCSWHYQWRWEVICYIGLMYNAGS